MTETTNEYDNRTVLMVFAVGTTLLALFAAAGPMSAGAYLIYQGSTASGAAAAGGGLASIGGVVTTYGMAGSVSTTAAIGLGMTGAGGAVALA